MLFDKYIVPEVLSILSVLANTVAIVTVLMLNAMVLIKSVLNKKAGILEDAENFSEHSKILEIVKSCYRCGLIFHILTWLLFAFVPDLTLLFAFLWGILSIVTATNGIASRIINGKATNSLVLFKKIKSFILYSIVYFVMYFLIY